MKTFLRSFLLLTMALYAGNRLSAQGAYVGFYSDINFMLNDAYYGCAPLTVNFFNMSDTSGIAGGPYWDWYIEGHGNFSTDTVPAITYTQGGYFEVTLTLSDDSGYVASQTQYIDVYPDGSEFQPMDGSEFCPGSPINFNLNVLGQGCEVSWDFGDGSIIIRNADYINHTYTSEGAYDVTVIVTHFYCGPDTIVQSINITAGAIPIVHATIEGSNMICPNEMVTFNTNDNFQSYLWDFGDGTSSTEFNPSHFFPAQDSTNYTVVLSVTNACGNVGTDPLEVQIRTTGIPADASFHMETPYEQYIENKKSSITVCPNTPVSFIPYNSAATYAWDLGDGSFSSDRKPVHYYTQPGWYYVSLTAINGCGSESTYLDSVEIYMNYGDTPYIDFSFDMDGWDWEDLQADTLSVCPGELVEFANDTYGGQNGEVRFIWDFGDGKTSTIKEPSHVYSGPGLYAVTLTGNAPCGGTGSFTKYVLVDNSLVPDVTLGVIPEIICPGERVFFWDENDYELNRYVYNIDFGDGNSANNLTGYTDSILMTLTNHVYLGAANDTFNYVFSAVNLCGNTFTKNGTIRITDDPNHKPFYYVENTTTSYDNQPMMDWGVRRDSSDHEFTIHINWPYWPSYQDTFAVYFWYGGFEPEGGDPGPANGYVTFTSDVIQEGDSVKAYIPLDPMYPPVIGLAAGWTCSGSYLQGIEVEAWGMQLDFTGAPITAFPLVPYGHTDLNTLGNSLTIDPAQEWDEVCNDQKPANRYYYQNSAADYVQLEFFEEDFNGDGIKDHNYYLYVSFNPEGYDRLTDIERGYYTLMGSNGIAFDNMQDCIGTYSFDVYPDSITFYLVNDNCSGLEPILTTKTFLRQLDFGYSEEDRSACVGDNVRFTIAGGVSYEWHFGDGGTSTLQFPFHSYAAAGTYDAFVIALNACGRTDTIYTPVEVSENNLPRADFWVEGWDFPRMEPVQFMWGDQYDNRAGNNSFLWNFGDGSTSTVMNPLHAYERNGEYKVNLTVTNGCGTNSWMQYIYVSDAILDCEARFSDSIVMGTDTVYFEDISRGNITSWFWEFGDGFISSQQNPMHVFPRDGIYFVCLSVLDSVSGCATQYCREVLLGVQDCRANFVYSSNDATNTVKFTDRSTSAMEWFWDFGDGSQPSNEQNPTHIYGEPGNYTVCLSIYNSGSDCYAEVCMDVEVGVTDSMFCAADFSFFVETDNSVRFTDKASSNITNWYWTFGDGTYIEDRNPNHNYSKPGNYQVCLIVFDQLTGCSAEICKQIPVGTTTCNVDAEYSFFIDITTTTVSFTNKSTGTITDYFWDFGNGTTSTMQNPKHQYAKAGFYLVKLSVRDQASDCSDNVAKFLQVGSVDCKAAFEYKVDMATQNVQFYQKSKGEIVEYFWNFDDGKVSDEPDPLHHFERPGLYKVSLTVINANGVCMDYYAQPVQVGSVNCAANFKYYVDSTTNLAYFTPEAIGTITDYLWLFGDGSVSSMENPRHQFVQPGYYTVGLNTYNQETGCMDYYEEIILIGQAGIDCRADFIYSTVPGSMTVKFKDQSKGNIVKWVWDFGDGSKPWSTLNDTTVHTYTKGGQYMVCLTVVNSVGIPNTYCEWVRIVSQNSEDCFANFYYAADSVSRTVKFKDASFGGPDQWNWEFGDNNTSVSQDPTNIYSTPAFYLVNLRIKNSTTGCESKHSELINVAQPWMGLQVGFSFEVDSSELKAESYPVDFVGVALGDAGKLQWSINGVIVDTTSMNPQDLIDSAGRYLVCLTIWDPVTDSSSTVCDSLTFGNSTVGIDPFRQDDFHLGNYPNPFDEMTNIVYELPFESEVGMAVYDHMGRMVDLLIKGDRQLAGSHRLEYNAAGLNSGIYILRLVIDQGVYTSKMIIQ